MVGIIVRMGEAIAKDHGLEVQRWENALPVPYIQTLIKPTISAGIGTENMTATATATVIETAIEDEIAP